MPYSKIDDLTALLPPRELLQLADDAGELGEADLAAAAAGSDDGPLDTAQAALRKVLREAIVTADREIDGHVGLVLPVPMTNPPGLVSHMSARLAICNLFARRPHLDPGPWKRVQAGIMRTLEKIAEGKIFLGPEPGKIATPQGQGAEIVAPGRIFGDESWKRY